MSTEENKALIRQVVDAFNKGDLEAIDHYFASHYVDHERARMGLPPGPAGVKQAWGMFRAAFPDLQGVIEDLIAEGDRVVVRGTFCGTHQGEFMGVAPTGKVATWKETHLLCIRDGRMAEHWASTDYLALLRQLKSA